MGRQIISPVRPDVLWRFWSFVDQREENDCWLWRKQGNRLYGNFTIDARNFLAHRFSYWLFNGEFDENLVVRHTCDISRCVNPNHLILGTQKENIQDKVEQHKHGSKRILTELQVLQIRDIAKDTDMSTTEIGKLFEVSAGCIGHILKGDSWSWLKGSENG